ncbi:cilia- and flagella-associated protein 157 [Pogona vitticeps]|nr:cilia- and flagella-associated protein 157 isoform X1 [Pogona vitticeps]XP_020649089.1 cilia- and flagella-associated protein 157 isoform X2 [Pogona vitticeps]
MAPKKKAGRKKDEAPKEPEIDEAVVPEHSREFYLIQIRDLEGRLARYQKKWDELQVNEDLFRAEYEKMVSDSKEIVAFLKKTLNQRVDEISDLTTQHQNLQQAKDAEKDAFEAQLAQLRHEFQETKDQLTSENMTLSAKLAALEEFRIQREEIMARFADLEVQLKKQEEEHRDTMYNLEKKAVIDKERLKKDMLHRVNAVAVEFRKVAHSQMAETTKRTIRENVALSLQLTKITEQSLQLIQENDRLKEARAKTLKQLELLEENEKKMATKNLSNQKIIWMLTNKCKELQAQVDEYLQMKVAMAETQQSSEALEQQNLVLREELKMLKEEVTRKTAERQDQVQSFQDEQQRRTCAEQVLRHTVQALKEILAIRPDEDEEGHFGVVFHLQRNDALKGLLNLLNRTIARIESNEALRPCAVESKAIRLIGVEESKASGWHLKASRLMSHYVLGVPKPQPAHSMPSVSMFSQIRAETVRPYASATEPLLTIWRAEEEEAKPPEEAATEDCGLAETVAERAAQELLQE